MKKKKVLIFGGGGIAAGIEEVLSDYEVSILPGNYSCDVTAPRWVFERMLQYMPDVVINCAGVSKPGSIKSVGYPEEINTNLIGSFHIAHAAATCKTETMIFIASVAGLYGKPDHAGYSASKAGVISLVQSLAMEGHNAYAISPGRVDTPMRERDYPNEDKRTRLEPSEIGQLVRDILTGAQGYEPGDNIILRRVGYETQKPVIDRGEPWKTELKVGQPKTI